MITSGRHAARAIDVGLATADTGSEQIAVLFEVTEGECQGEQITWYGYFTEKTTKRTIESLRHCGWQGNDLAALTAEDMPNEVTLVCEDDTYNGETRVKVKWVNRLGSGLAVKARMDSSAAASFAARMKGACMAIKPSAPAAAPKPRPAQQPTQQPTRSAQADYPENDASDEIPF